MPVFNRPRLLQEAVASVVAQTYRPIEVVVVDDASTDDTPDAAQALLHMHPEIVRFVRLPTNSGPGVAREAGREQARGEYIQYLDSDDVLLPEKFACQVGGLCRQPQCGVSYGRTRFRHRDGSLEAAAWKGSGNWVATMFPSFLVSRWWDTPTPLYRRELCDRAGPWSALSQEEDWEYDCRIAALGVELHYCPRDVCEVRDHGEDRLCRGAVYDANRLRQRARSHELIYGHAVRAGLEQSLPEMQHFARALFLLSRQCGKAGLDRESRRLFELAREASGETRAGGLDFRLYALGARLAGWNTIGRLSCWLDEWTRRV